MQALPTDPPMGPSLYNPPEDSPISTGVKIAAVFVVLGLLGFTYAMVARYVPGARGALSERGAVKLIGGMVAFTVVCVGTTIVIHRREKSPIEEGYIRLDQVEAVADPATLPQPRMAYNAQLAQNTEILLKRVSNGARKNVVVDRRFEVDASRTPGLRAASQEAYMQRKTSIEFLREAAKFNTIIVNITHPEDKHNNTPLNYTDSRDFKAEYPRKEARRNGVCTFMHKSEFQKECIHISSWPENSVLNEENAQIYFTEAVNIALKLKCETITSIFVHSKRGHERTATFLLMIELALDMLHEKITQDTSNDEIRSTMIEILKDIARKSRDRLPNRQQLDFLLNDRFINIFKRQYVSRAPA